MVIRSICCGFVFLTLGVLVTTESNETLREAPLLRCVQVIKKIRPRFHLVRRCARSDARVLITANFSSLWRCSEFAFFKRGLAVNFGWIKDGLGLCEVLECPEHDTLASLRRRDNYDYYSLYANPLPSMDWLCVPKVGIFRIGYGEAQSVGKRKCKEWALMPTPQNNTKGENGTNSSLPGDQTGMTSIATARPSDHVTKEVQSSSTSSSPTTPSPTQTPPVPPFPFPPPFENGPFGPPFLPPDDFQAGQGEFSPWGPEYRLSETLNATNATAAKPRAAGLLANVLSQDRTNDLTKFLLSKIGKLFPPILIGLATVPGDPNLFATAEGEPLPCFRFRAWAPGHPLPLKRLNAVFQQSSSTLKPSVAKSNDTAKPNSTDSQSNLTEATKNETMNSTKPEETNVAERKRDAMTLCVYLHRDGLWHTALCSTKTLFLCELLPSGGPCRDANSTDERAECEYQKIGTKDDRCSAWNGEMITTTMMPIESDKGDSDSNKGDGDSNKGDGDNNKGDGDNNKGDGDNNNGDGDSDKEDGDNNNGDYDNEDDDNDNSYEENVKEDGEYEDSDDPSEDNENGNNGDKENDDYDYGNNDEDNNNNSKNGHADTVIRDDTV